MFALHDSFDALVVLHAYQVQLVLLFKNIVSII